MEGAKPSQGVCQLKTGIMLPDGKVEKELHFRELCGPEEDILAMTKLRVSDKLTKIMQNCTLKIGPYEDRKSINQAIEKMVTTDRWMYLVQLRILSVGKDYVFPVECPECSAPDRLHYDLEQVKVECNADAANLYRDSSLTTGKKVRWKLADGKVESRIEEMSRETNAATAALYARIENIDDKPVSVSDVLQMSLKERGELRRLIDKEEGSIDDEVDVADGCPKCGHVYKTELPLDGRSFFYPAES